MHEDSCIGINYAHMFSKCFRSLHTLLGFALYFMSSILIIVAVTINSILTCTPIPYRDSHCENGSFEVLSLHLFYLASGLCLSDKASNTSVQTRDFELWKVTGARISRQYRHEPSPARCVLICLRVSSSSSMGSSSLFCFVSASASVASSVFFSSLVASAHIHSHCHAGVTPTKLCRHVRLHAPCVKTGRTTPCRRKQRSEANNRK